MHVQSTSWEESCWLSWWALPHPSTPALPPHPLPTGHSPISIATFTAAIVQEEANVKKKQQQQKTSNQFPQGTSVLQPMTLLARRCPEPCKTHLQGEATQNLPGDASFTVPFYNINCGIQSPARKYFSSLGSNSKCIRQSCSDPLEAEPALCWLEVAEHRLENAEGSQFRIATNARLEVEMGVAVVL